MSMVKSLESHKDLQGFIDRFDNFLFDCDGVIWHGERAHQRAKFDRLGIQADLDEIFGSAYATALYLKRILKFPDDKKVYVIGEKGLEDELASENLKFCGGTTDKDVGAVMCGFDMHINYKKLAKAHRYLHENPDCHFILTNDDSLEPSRSCMIGDRLDTDIAFGINGGLSTLLVLTGVVTRADISQTSSQDLTRVCHRQLG
ncbi:hypothetical protein PGTUg99_000463 [Puccinia graminis f. sp. tritici]|uniref:4-nitrophenylphosphatase n=1 Tax=Puccinia graminis f. sp. tritici TaxID=56615 RepID=A0A5B0SG13_PUCGR|nr:hypothetical protein PGTUg99_000463 [Puccinia graminis f. sp. tritici]